MDRLGAFARMIQQIRASDDAELIEALEVVIAPPPRDPPGALGAVAGAAQGLANQAGEMAWKSERWPSAGALEVLVFRLVKLLEAFEGALAPGESGARDGYLLLLGEIWALAAWDGVSPDSIATALTEWAKNDKRLAAEMARIDARQAATESVGE